MSEIEGKRFILNENPGTLQKLASISVAAELWREEITQCGAHDRPLNFIGSVLESQSKMPITVAKLIDSCIEPVRKSLYWWLKAQFLQVFMLCVKEYDILRKYFDCIAWRADCSIDKQQTAENMIACAGLDDFFKYQIASTYCLEDHVRRLWSVMPLNHRILNETEKETFPMIYYWQRRLMCTCNNDEVHNSMDMKTFEIIKPDNWSAWKYCWSKLSAKDQIDEAVLLIQSKGELRHVIKYLLAVLTTRQLVKVMKRCSQQIMIGLARNREDVRYAWQIWQLIKNMIPGKNYVRMFVEILDAHLDVNVEKLTTTANSIKQHNPTAIIRTSEMVNVNVSKLLYDIWLDSPDHLKTFLFDKHVVEILGKLCQADRCHQVKLSRDVRLMIELLSRRNHLSNNPFWRKHWIELINGISAANLEKIMKLCFRNDKDILKFKKTQMTVYSKIEKYCSELMSEGHFDELNEFLNFCTSDRNVKADLKRSILRQIKSTMTFCILYADDPVKMRSFDEFISDAYSNPDIRRNLKCKLITSNDNFEYLLNLVYSGFVIPTKNIVSLFVTRDADMKQIKKIFKKYCHSGLSKGEFYSFNARHWNEFLLWCMNDDQQEVDRFRLSLPIDHIYRSVFLKCINTVEYSLIKYNEMYKKTDEDSDDEEYDDEEDDDEWTDDSDSNDDELIDTDDDISDEDSSDDEHCVCDRCDSISEQLLSNANFYIDEVITGFQRLDNFLMWYFGSKTKVQEFKLAKINQRNVSPLKEIFTSKREHLIHVILHWFFDRDIDQIQKFKASLKLF